MTNSVSFVMKIVFQPFFRLWTSNVSLNCKFQYELAMYELAMYLLSLPSDSFAIYI